MIGIAGINKIFDCIVNGHGTCQGEKSNHPSEKVKRAGFKLEKSSQRHWNIKAQACLMLKLIHKFLVGDLVCVKGVLRLRNRLLGLIFNSKLFFLQANVAKAKFIS